MNNSSDMREELKELIRLVKLNEKYTAVVLDGVLPPDQQSSEYHHQRTIRIDEISRKYELI